MFLSDEHCAKPALGANMLVSGCASMRSGGMPLPQYRLMHPDAKLSPRELDRSCDWAKTEALALTRRQRYGLLGTAAGGCSSINFCKSAAVSFAPRESAAFIAVFPRPSLA